MLNKFPLHNSARVLMGRCRGAQTEVWLGPIEFMWFATARASVQIRSDKDTRRASTVRATAALKDVEAQLENLTTAMAQGGKRSGATRHFGTSVTLVSFPLGYRAPQDAIEGSVCVLHSSHREGLKRRTDLCEQHTTFTTVCVSCMYLWWPDPSRRRSVDARGDGVLGPGRPPLATERGPSGSSVGPGGPGVGSGFGAATAGPQMPQAIHTAGVSACTFIRLWCL
jgi:hypothetical protein